MKKQTAVEWLRRETIQLLAQAMQGTLNIDTLEGDVYRIVTQAKEMEKEQIVNAYNDCEWTGDHEDGEQYYNETFNKSINNKG
jgi:hypothetical protein